MKEKERYTIISFWNGEKEDRGQLLRKLGLHVETEEFYDLIYSPHPGVKTSVSRIPVAMADHLQKHLTKEAYVSIKFIHRSRPIHYDKAYAILRSRFGFSHMILNGGKYPEQWLLVSEPDFAEQHKDKVLAFQKSLWNHGYKLNEGECLQIDVCKSWKETK